MALRDVRKRRRLTQQELAAKSGVPQQTISGLETNPHQSPEWRTVSALCEALRVRPEELFGSAKEAGS